VTAAGVTEEFAPVIDGPVGGKDGGRAFIPSHNEFEEIFGRGVRQLPHAEIIDDEERHGDGISEIVFPPCRRAWPR
jgi:hypothetical protein